MGWGLCVNAKGRDCGYMVGSTCDKDGCEAKIDRGLDYVCGGMHDGGEHGCGGYFCDEHCHYWWREAVPVGDDVDEEMSEQLCEPCGQRWQAGDDL